MSNKYRVQRYKKKCICTRKTSNYIQIKSNLSLIAHTLYCQLRVHNGFVCYLYYAITMRLLCDSYPLLILCLSPRYSNGMVTEKIILCATAISAKSAQTNPKNLDTNFALFAVCALSYKNGASYITCSYSSLITHSS